MSMAGGVKRKESVKEKCSNKQNVPSKSWGEQKWDIFQQIKKVLGDIFRKQGNFVKQQIFQ